MISRDAVSEWLRATGTTKRRLADAAGVHESRMYDWLSGRRDIYLTTAQRIAEAMSRIDSEQKKVGKSTQSA